MECSLNLCAQTFQNTSITNGTFSAGPITETSLTGGKLSKNNGEREWLFQLNTTTSPAAFPGNSTIIVNSLDFQLLAEYVEETFTSPDDTAFGNALRSSPNMTETIANISTSITYAIGASKFANQTLGFAVTTEQYIHVRWAWIAPPIAIVVMGAVFLILTIVHTMRAGVTSWKSSSILPLFAHLDGWDEDGLRAAAGPVKGLERKAKAMCGMVRVDRDTGKVLFVKTQGGTSGTQISEGPRGNRP